MEVDEALETVGGYRRWHLPAAVLLSFSTFLPICLQSFSIVFIGWEPPYHCKVPLDVPLNQSIPHTEKGWKKCKMYVNSSIDNSTTECNNGVHYYNDGYETIVTEFDLVCQSDFLSDLSQMIYVCLHAVAEIGASYLCDRFGRKRVHVIGHVIMAILGTAVSFSPNYVCFVILRTMVGMTTQATGNSGMTLLMELFGMKHRDVIVIGANFLWVLSYLVPALTVYILKDWRIYQLVVSLSSIIWIGYICFLTESVPWLVAKKRYAEVDDILQTMAKRNGVIVEKIMLRKEQRVRAKFTPMERDYEKSRNNEEGTALNCDQSEDCLKDGDIEDIKYQQSQVPIRDLFCDKKLRLHLLMCNLFWLANVMVYSGLILMSPALGSNRFFNYCLMGIVEIPAYIVCLFLVKRYGRKIPQMVMFFLTGAVMGIAAFVPKETASGTDLSAFVLTLALVGKFGITSSFAIMGLYARELFPTTLRSSSSAYSTIGGTLGSIAAPLASYLARHVFWLPNLLFAVAAITAGLATLPLPETMNKPLPLTTADIYRLYYNTQPPNDRQGKTTTKTVF